MSHGTPVGDFDRNKSKGIKIPLTADELQNPNFRIGQ
jgi:hypothetical protein